MNASAFLSRGRRNGRRIDHKANLMKSAPVIDGLVAAGVLVALLVAILISTGFRDWLAGTLGYGWLPVLAWVCPVVVALRYRPGLLISGRRYVLVGAVGVAVVLGIMSVIGQDGRGTIGSGLAGSWGSVLGGEHMGIGIIKILGLFLIIPLVLFPRHIGTAGAHLFFWMALRSNLLVRSWYARLAKRLALSKGPLGFPWRSRIEPSTETEKGPETGLSTLSVVNETRNLVSDALERFAKDESRGYIGDGGLGGTGRLMPAIGLLSQAETVYPVNEEFHDMARLIERTLASHGVDVEVRDVQVGPRLVRFGLSPGWQDRTEQGRRVRVQSIVARETDIALALGIPGIRIQPIIPGEALIGIEVPVATPHDVGLAGMMQSSEFTLAADGEGLPVPLGRDIGSGNEVVDLAELPHLLIAGGTGSGKSVCLNAMVLSMLFTCSPNKLRIVMVDPKGVEFAPYEDIPHLIAPVIGRSEEFGPALDALILIMRQRYELFKTAGVRDIRAYNRRPEGGIMPFVVVLVDELAELMLSGGRYAEDKLVRIAQQGRAAGLHLILSTQRPTVDVVTGLLKANISARIAFSVATQADSRVILDVGGAEKLIGKGDMLVVTGESRVPKRLQGVLVEDGEIERIVDFWVNPPDPVPISS